MEKTVEQPQPKKSRKSSIILIILLFIWFALASGISLYIDSIWFESLGYWQIFSTIMTGRFISFLLPFMVTFTVLWINGWFSSRVALGLWTRPDLVDLAKKGTSAIFMIVALVAALLVGFVAQLEWFTVYQFIYQVPAEVTDPIFGLDLAFYFFSLPFYEKLAQGLLALFLLSLTITSISYVINGHLGYDQGLKFSRVARTHLTILLSITGLATAFYFWLTRFQVLYSQAGVVFGAGYTDLNAWIPCYWMLTILATLTSVLLLLSLKAPTLRFAVGTGIGFVLAYLILNVYPALIQTFVVAPNEIQKETPFIKLNIESTLRAYNLHDIETHEFSPDQPLTRTDLENNKATLGNIRLWDWRPLKNAYDQLQSIRLYYEFHDADIDRYIINQAYRQVMLSVRELDFSKISENAQNWINRHFQYTHGQGLCMSPVNEVSDEGLPEFFIQDIPPRSRVDIEIDRPEIYFGEKTDYPVFVRTKLEEFDYPLGDQNATSVYLADRGLPIDSILMRLFFSWELGIYQILFTRNFTDDSRVLLHRKIQDRIPKLAPFLSYDNDPYAVIDQGRLFWMQDAYTVTDRFPYSEPFPNREEGEFNYIRNSVKVVVDAYLGDTTFYITDDSDPLIRVYSKIFPDLFKNFAEMPDGLRQHIRYPTDYFDVQRQMFGRYHMKDPTVFYNQEDLWVVPNEIYGGNEQQMESYYVIMSLPGEKQEEFILLIPYTPTNKNNMIAWLAARSDGEDYGKLVLFQFPKQELTYGPMQIEARIDQNPDISQLITLWGQKGSRVIRGNLLVIPIENSLLYVEPLYLQAEKSEIPELTRILAVYQSQVAIGETLEEALENRVNWAKCWNN